MSERVKTITDKTSFEEILNKYFKSGDVYLKTKDENQKIDFFGCFDSNAVFKIPSIKNISDNNIVFSRNENNIIKADISFFDKKENNTFVFNVNEIQIITQSRKEERKSLNWRNTADKRIIFITKIISDAIIQNSLSLDFKKTDRIRKSFTKEMSKAFNYVKIFFCNEGKGNTRMNFFLRNRDPLFIPDINIQVSDETSEEFNFYKNNIYLKDHYLKGENDLISEISVPVLFKGKIPYGYIQVNNKSPLTDSILPVVGKCALLIDDMMNREKIFPYSDEKVIVSNISRNGLGVVFRESKYLRYFKKNNYIYFDLFFPDEHGIAVMAQVRNISPTENKNIMIGCSIEELSEADEILYKHYVDSLLRAEKK